ncbi:ATP-binding protein, partial [Acinetobacter baumannii]
MVVFAMFHRIHGECLANIARHAAASRVEITLEALPGQALLVTRDDGRGFDPDQVSGDHLGLQIMHERAQHIGATLEID